MWNKFKNGLTVVTQLVALVVLVIAAYQLVLQSDQAVIEAKMAAWEGLSRNMGDYVDKSTALQHLIDIGEDLTSVHIKKSTFNNILVGPTARLSGLVWPDCRLNNTTLRNNASLKRLTLNGSHLLNVRASNVDLDYSSFLSTTIKDFCIGAAERAEPGPVCSNPVHSSASVKLKIIEEDGLNSDIVNKQGSLKRADFTWSTLTDVYLNGIDLRAAIFDHVTATRLTIIDSVAKGAFFRNSSFRGLRIVRSNLLYADFSGATITDGIFDLVYLTYARFIRTECRECLFSPKSLYYSNFCGADIRYARFPDNDFQYIASIQDANVFGATPEVFRKWALDHGAVEIREAEKWNTFRQRIECH